MLRLSEVFFRRRCLLSLSNVCLQSTSSATQETAKADRSKSTACIDSDTHLRHTSPSGGSVTDGSGCSSSSLLPYDLDSISARAYFENPLVGQGVRHFLVGRFVQRLTDDEFLVDMHDVLLSPIAEVDSRVYVLLGKTSTNAGRVVGGIVGKVNSNGTLGVLLDNATYMNKVSQSDLYLVHGRTRYTIQKEYIEMREWVRDAGVRRNADVERICSMLYQRGWRENRLYMLQGPDIHCMTYLKKSVRMAVLEKAEWQRMHHGEECALLRERVKEREPRYFVQKFSGFVSACWAGMGVMSVFLWNFKNFRKQQRAFQMKHAVNTLTQQDWDEDIDKRQFVKRVVEENWARNILRRLDISRPRIAVLTGFSGSGKSSLFRAAVHKENKPALFVEVRGKEDTLSCIVKSLKVPIIEACGDYLDFITDAFQKSTQMNGEPPILVIILREGSELSRVYNETVVLACDRMLCHLVFDVPLESLTIQNISLPRVDFYNAPMFSSFQAFQYTQHSTDPVAMKHFVEVLGTNSNDIDELLAAVYHRKMKPAEYTNMRLAKAMRQVQAACEDKERLYAALKKLAESKFTVGLHTGVDSESLRDPALRDIVFYDPVQDRWVFKHKVLHTATRCCL